MQRVLEKLSALKADDGQPSGIVATELGLVGVQLRDYQIRAINFMLDARRFDHDCCECRHPNNALHSGSSTVRCLATRWGWARR